MSGSDSLGEPVETSDLRPGEVAVPLPARHDQVVYFIGTIRTPWRSRKECPRRGDPENGPVCRVEVDERPVHPPHRCDLVRGPRNQDHPVGLYALMLTRNELSLGRAALVDQAPAKAVALPPWGPRA